MIANSLHYLVQHNLKITDNFFTQKKVLQFKNRYNQDERKNSKPSQYNKKQNKKNQFINKISFKIITYQIFNAG